MFSPNLKYSIVYKSHTHSSHAHISTHTQTHTHTALYTIGTVSGAVCVPSITCYQQAELYVRRIGKKGLRTGTRAQERRTLFLLSFRSQRNTTKPNLPPGTLSGLRKRDTWETFLRGIRCEGVTGWGVLQPVTKLITH